MQTLSSDETAAHQQAFAENGYVIIKGAVPQAQLAELRIKLLDELEHSQHKGNLFNGGGGISGHLNCTPGEDSRFAYDALIQSGIVALVKELAPQSFGPMRAACNMNLP